MKVKLLIVIGIAALLGSCKKETTHTPTPIPEKDIYLDGDKSILKDYFFFKEGTYWVYKDSISHVTDTVRVTKSYTGLADAAPQHTDTIIKYEAFSCMMNHSKNSGISYYSFDAIQPYIQYHSELFTYGIIFTSPVNGGQFKPESGVVFIMPGETPVSVNGFNFPAGVQMPWVEGNNREAQINPTKPPIPTMFKITYAKDAGIIKREIKNDTLHQIWELVDYKIVN